MNRGCLIALVVFAVCMVLLVVLVVVVPLYVFDIIDSAPRVPVATFLTEDSVAAMVIDPNHQELINLIDQQGQRWSWFLPHELGAVVDLDAARKKRTVTFAGSPKHLGPAFMLMFGNKDALPLQELEREGGMRGIDTLLTPAFTREKGAIILRGEGAVEPETESIAAEHWPEAAPRVPPKLTGGHVLEVVIRNDGGEAILALEPFIRVEPGTAAESSTAAANADAQPAAEAAPEAASEGETTQGEGEAESTEQAGNNDASALGLLLYASEITAHGDFTEGGDFKITIVARVKDEASIEAATAIVDGLRDIAKSESEKDEITVTGATTAADGVVTGEIVYSGYEEQFTKWLDQKQQSRY
ncbi:MAG: hypothetical protein HUU46_11440 [Candidatus Hydrogenedentes bacterium]|nr:hypothetical protein [Candidatus Hydrogenedentota bacterium]